MPQSIRSILRRSWSSFYTRGIELLTADQITRRSWARRVETYSAIPDVYRGYLDAHLPDPGDFSGGVITPTFQGFLRPENERLVMRLGDCIHVLERQKDQLTAIVYPINEIDTLEQGSILLRAWLTLTGTDLHGELRRVTFKYNSVTECLFFPLIETVRRVSALATSGLTEFSAETRAAIGAIEPLSFKFRNFARRSLLPGEQIQASVFQSEILRPRLKAFDRVWLHRRLCPTHLCLLTGSELILICDDPDVPAGLDQQPYGGIWTFIPRRRVTTISLEPAPDGCLRLHISLCGGSTVETLFDASIRDQLEKIVSN